MNTSKSFSKKFPKTSEFFNLRNIKNINVQIAGLLRFKEENPDFVPGMDMLEHFFKYKDSFDMYNIENVYIVRVKGLLKKNFSEYFIVCDIFRKNSKYKEYWFTPDIQINIETLLNKNITTISKERYDKMFIKDFGEEYLKSIFLK